MKIKKFLVAAVLVAGIFSAKAQEEAPKNWFNLDLEKDSVPGVSTERAYNELLKGRTSKTVIVAVIDDGIDYQHEDLKDVIWVNEDEIPGNGIDDDNNGYVDDVHGWNFLGGKNGNVDEDTYEVTRLFAYYSRKFADVDESKLSKEDKKEYAYYKDKVKPYFLEKYYENSRGYTRISAMYDAIAKIEKDMNGDITLDKLKNYKTTNEIEELTVKNLKTFLGYDMSLEDIKGQFKQAVDHYKKGVEKSFNVDFNPRTIVGDNYEDASERIYGNNDYRGPSGSHGSHVAGIIGAIRSNNLGMSGVADNVKIMVVRVVPDGDERDKDVANGIRYAVDNGATVINMSFGKAFTYNKKAVDEAVKYAMSKDVLMVHAAGNDGIDIDITTHYPTDMYEEKGMAKSWIEVGATTWMYTEDLVAPFSNYGAKSVDVFAPGMEINSTVPDNKYASYSGTSMASPVTAGVAALIRSYFPDLTAEQVKDILLKSATPVPFAVNIPGMEEKEKLKKVSTTGGIVNVYKAVQLAMKTKGKKK